MPYIYAVLGAGRQGTAAAYDMARWGDAKQVLLVDVALDAARRASERVNQLIGREMASAAELDVTDSESLGSRLRDVDSFLSAVPYYHNLDITRAAIEAKAHMCDLGGNTDIAREQHGFDQKASDEGISIIPNCGQVPGLGTTLMVYAMELLDEATDVLMCDGGIPAKPRPPFHYLLTFNIAGLTNEYAEPAVFLREGKVTEMEPMSELETVEFPEPIGALEAFVAGGGTDTMPWTFEGKLRTLQNKTLRHPGHFAQLRAFYDLGLWSLEPVRVGDTQVVPRDIFHALFEPKVTYPVDEDIVIIRIKAMGKKEGRDAEALVELIDTYDEETGFTAMERATGWSAAIVAEMMARGETPRGAGGVETQVPARPFLEKLRRRGFSLKEEVSLCG
jgi:lysine 6-dehydrogenase